MASFGGRDPKIKCTQSRKTGKCMLQGYELKKIPIELLDPFNHLEGNELPQYVSLVTKLNLCDNDISVIPDNIDGIGGECAVFEIRNNKLKCLPSAMSGLVGLKVIDASNNEISEVQELDLPQLADLNLAKNVLSKLPDMSNLNMLSRLTLSHNKLSVLPDSIGGIPNLRHLIVDNNNLTSLPSFKSGNSIETISISFNQLTNLPESLNQCNNLTSLDVSTNKLTKWPSLPLPSDGKGGLVSLILNNNRIPNIDGDDLLKIRHSLQNFQIANCGLLTAPPEFGAMRRLKTLNIESNELKDVPGTLGYLPELNSLMTVGNPIRRKNLDHPNNKELLKYLRTKDDIHPLLAKDLAGGSGGGGGGSEVSATVGKKLREAAHYGTLSLVWSKSKSDQLVDFPDDILQDPLASSLTELIVTGHADLVQFPFSNIVNLKKVVHLDLSNNGFIKANGSGGGGRASESGSETMQFMAQLANLKTLSSLKLRNLGLTDRHFNCLEALPLEKFLIGSKLKEFDISNNQLNKLPLSFLLKCSHLEIFTAPYNSIQGIENDVPFIEKMKSLAIVDLSNNRLTDLGQLVYLPTLQVLNVESNQIKSVAPEICLLKNLKSLLIGQNSIRSIPGDVVSGGHVKLINFLKNRLPDNYEEPEWVVTIKNGGKKSSGGSSTTTAAAAVASSESEGAALDPKGQLVANLDSLNKEIKDIEELLETSLSAATKHATKKKLQIKKAERNRVERQVKDM